MSRARATLTGALLIVIALAIPLTWCAVAIVTMVIGGQITTAAAAACQGAAPTDGTSGPTRIPIVGAYTVSSEFGMRMHPTLRVMKLHAGIDLPTKPAGGVVVAAHAGVIESTVTTSGEGNVVTINHGGGLTTRYLHLQRWTTTAGRTVAAGTPIGIEGNTGERTTGPHLHFEVRRNGVPQDPRPWLEAHGVQVPPRNGAGIGLAPDATQATTTPPTNATPTRIGAWSGQQLVIAGQIITAARARGVDDWTVTLAVAVSMAESSLENKPHGDRVRQDTIGIFQEGPERGPYAQRMDPTGATNIFLDYLLAVPGYRDMAPSAAAHKAQRNADPHVYDITWPDAVTVVGELTHNPSLANLLAATDGSQPDCGYGTTNDDPTAMPPPPSSSCPNSGSTAEAGLTPSTVNLLRCGKNAFPKITTMYGLGQRDGPSDHTTGKAVDFMIDDYRTPDGRAYGWKLATWVRANAAKLNVTYVIYDQKIWSRERDSEGWRVYDRYAATPADPTLAHKDHVHVSSAA